MAKEQLYGELLSLVLRYLKTLGRSYDIQELWEVVLYQVSRVPNLYWDTHERHFIFNVPEYFDRYFTNQRCQLEKKRQVMYVSGKDYYGDKQAFAQEVLLYGRKSERMLYSAIWKEEASGS
jgi:hypothetical protein